MNNIYKFLRYVFFAGIMRFLIFIVVGVNIRHRERLPQKGPAVIVANHNSHLDTVVLINLLPQELLPDIHPVAAADYFLKNKLIAWFSKNIVGIIPVSRSGIKGGVDPLIPCYEALDENKILIVYPEGTRGKSEQLAPFKKGIAYLAKHNPDVPIIPVFIHGLGKTRPQGESVFVPFLCDMFVGEAISWTGDKETFMQLLNSKFEELIAESAYKK